MKELNSHFTNEINRIIAIPDLKGAADLILNVTEMKDYDVTLSEQSKNVYIILAELSELKNFELGGRISFSEANLQKNNLRHRIITISEIVAQSYNEYIDLTKIKPAVRKVKITRNILALLLTVCVFGGFLTYKKIIDDINSVGVVLVGSGTVYNYLHKNFKEIFQYSLNKQVVAPLECPSSIGKEVLINSYQRGEPENSGIPNMNMLPEVVGMYSSTIHDSIFNESPIQPNKKYYAIQIGVDKLILTIGGKDLEMIKSLWITDIIDNNGGKKRNLRTTELKKLIEEHHGEFHLLTTSTESGTFKSWSESLNIPTSALIKYRHPRDFDFSDNTKKFIKNDLTNKPWVILGSDEYQISAYTNSDNPPKFSKYEILKNNDEIARRPLFLYGKFEQEEPVTVNWNGNEYSVFKLDESVCKFWKRMIGLMNKQNDKVLSTHITSLKQDFLIFEDNFWKCNCGIVPRSDMDRLTTFTIKEDK